MNPHDIVRLPDAISAFLDYERFSRSVTPKTSEQFKYHLRMFQRFWRFQEWQGRPLEGRQIDLYLQSMARRGCGDCYRRNAYTVLRCFFRWAWRRKVRDQIRKVIDLRQVNQILEAVRTSNRMHAKRDHALIATLFYAGLRIGEACGLKTEDVDFGAGIVRVIGKGGKLRVLPLHPNLTEIFKVWIPFRAKNYPACEWLFPSRAAWHHSSGKLDECDFRKWLRIYYLPAAKLRSAGITPHVLRRSFATRLRKRKVPIEHVQRLLGHSRLDTTRRYVMELPEELRASLRRL